MNMTNQTNRQPGLRGKAAAVVVGLLLRICRGLLTQVDSNNPIEAISLRAYARHRGVSAPSVLRAIRRGSLKHSLVRDAAGHTKIANVALADAEWPARPNRKEIPH